MLGMGGRDERQVRGWVRDRLVGIETNPGPTRGGTRSKGEGRRRRNMARYGRRRVTRSHKELGSHKRRNVAHPRVPSRLKAHKRSPH